MSDIIELQLLAAQSPLVLGLSNPAALTLALDPSIEIGGSSPSTFVWTQTVPAAVWDVPHNLNRYPSVTLVDTQGVEVHSDVAYIDSNIVRVTFAIPTLGKAYLN